MAIDVAAGVLLNDQGQVLLAQRPQGKVYAGWWEVPGGKFEPGEDAHQALARELHEELGLRIERSSAWYRQEYHYPHGHVRLHFRRVWHWEGEPLALESQVFAWIDPVQDDLLRVSPILPATEPMMNWLALPAHLKLADPRASRIGWLDHDGLDDIYRLVEASSATALRPLYLRHGDSLFDFARLIAMGRLDRTAAELALALDQLSSSLASDSPSTR